MIFSSMNAGLGLDLFRLVAGFVLLIGGAECLVRGASRLAASFGISSLVIGLTVVAFGTSAPELAVSVFSGLQGQTDIALGNVIGSNIFNVLLILGLSALIAPLSVSRSLIRLDVPLMIAASIAVFFLGMDGRIGHVEGGMLCAGMLGYTIFLIVQSRRAPDSDTKGPADGSCWVNGGWILLGLGLLVIGSNGLVKSASSIASQLGVGDLVIGLTIVAGGTSLPELATSLVASFRGERDIAIGNVVGSNLFNLLSVLGLAALVAPEGISVSLSALQFDLPVMITAAGVCLPVFFTGLCIARWEGGLFAGYYIVYLTFLVLEATSSNAVSGFSKAICWFVLPLTAVTLCVSVCQSLRLRR